MVSVKPGGHYFKSGNFNNNIDRYDKIPCSVCHDPHDYTNQAFIRKDLAGSSVTNLKASTFMANAPYSGTRVNDTSTGSRQMCITCHNAVNPATPDVRPPPVKNYTNLPGGTYSQDIVTPVTGIEEHLSTNTRACTECHKHNSIEAGCNDCHSYPAQDNTNSGRQLSPVHWKHAGFHLPAGYDNSHKFDCKVCHFNYNHNQSGYTARQPWSGFNPATVNVRFDPAWNPGEPTYADAPAGTDNAPGVGGNGQCKALYCHGDAGVFTARKTGSDTQPKWDNVASGACGTCHGTATQMISGNHPVHLDNTAKPFGPGIDNTTCGTGGGCHTAYGLSPTTSHVDTTISFRTGPGNSDNVSLGGTTICANCHSTATAAFDNGTGSGVGDTLAKNNWLDNGYKLPCLTCHNNTTQANSKIDGTGAAAPNIERYWLLTGHGAAVIDNGSTATINLAANPPIYQDVPVPCAMCHEINSRHYGTTLVTGNAWRLRALTGYDDPNGGMDKFCNTQCHGSAPGSYAWNGPTLPQDHTWILAASPPETKEPGADTHPTSMDVVSPGKTEAPPLLPYPMPLDNAIRLGGTQNFLCVTCHDPHGIGPSAAAPRSFTGTNSSPSDNVHMLRYIHTTGSALCRKCHS